MRGTKAEVSALGRPLRQYLELLSGPGGLDPPLGLDHLGGGLELDSGSDGLGWTPGQEPDPQHRLTGLCSWPCQMMRFADPTSSYCRRRGRASYHLVDLLYYCHIDYVLLSLLPPIYRASFTI